MLVQYAWLIAIFGVISMVYGAFLSLAQDDLKSMVAYSSVSHMGFVLLGIATLTTIGVAGAVFQMFAHGLISAALFMLCGSVHHATGTRRISKLGGIASKMPLFAALTMAAFLASLGLPGMAGFIGEVMVFIATFSAFGWWILIPIITVALTAGYYLYALQRAYFGPFRRRLGKVHNVHRYETFPITVLIGLTVLFGIWPALFLNAINTWIGGIPIFG
jgi:NADH-quinone oxidoreductase subunit M